ncbi:MAG: type II toxin-antitoxin system HicA family toxin [Acidimicrobiia bacterium]|nr:type II toxin-antitoxin system HicA family toxin [Acidimicrobiia bacterium]
MARVRGSHHIFVKPGTNLRISIPVHGNRTLKRGLHRYLMKLAEIEEADLKEGQNGCCEVRPPANHLVRGMYQRVNLLHGLLSTPPVAPVSSFLRD